MAQPPQDTGWVVVRETAYQVPFQAMPGMGYAQPQPPKWEGRDIGAAILGVMLPVLLFTGFMTGLGAINRPAPDTGLATTWYAACGILGILGAILGVALGPSRAGLRIGIAAAIAAPLGIWIALMAQSSYDDFSGFWLFWLAFFLCVAVGVTTLVLGSRGGRTAGDGALIGGLGVSFAVAGAAFYHLATISHQAELAAQAHEASAPVAVLVLLMLLGMAALRRR